MRPMNGFHVTGAAAAAPPSSTIHRPTSLPHSAWHSPVPYLFGGLAAMLGLIAFALLILACSYWKLSGYLDADDGRDASADSEAAGGGDALVKPSPPESFVVIMAGDCKPTFLATPAAGGSAASSFNGRSGEAGEAAAALADAKKTAESAVSSRGGDATQGSRSSD
ncbi:protein GLUTAMINE DUMPER 2-like [Zingiber officinale]|uniref:protein GLUTAMINE DUMPER 2-like n=1 Tax=Zingiber officinale TaxID=94328 RepID=UPI001C4AFD19|nr:protein GLUTAMINE DUMPER 2-like [Zingiber officinale]